MNRVFKSVQCKKLLFGLRIAKPIQVYKHNFIFSNALSTTTVGQDARQASTQGADTKSEKTNTPEPDDFLYHHGGKIALASVFIAVGLVYRWIKNGQNRVEKEKEMTNSYSLDAIEISEIRSTCKLSNQEYMQLINECYNRYPTGKITYPEFISLLQTLKYDRYISLTHLLDRIPIKLIQSLQT